jgi:quercetin dioxygenase-like cupin family protein
MRKTLLVISAFFICFTAASQYNKGITIETLLKTDTTTLGQKIRYPQFKDDQVTLSKVTIPPGESTGWHKHEIPVFAYVLKGSLTVELENKKTTQFPENSSFAEVLNTFHNGKNEGSEDVVLIAIYLGGVGTELTVRK